MNSTPLRSVIEDLSADHRANLAAILELATDASVNQICESLRWMYRSRARAKLTATAADGLHLLKSTVRKARSTIRPTDELFPTPTWEVLVGGLARYLKVHDPDGAMEANELYISHAIILRALNKMTAVHRAEFFAHGGGLDKVVDHATHGDGRLRGPARTAAALGLANAAGFSLYTASTTALGFVTHAVGITLPFAAFTGLTSSIAFVIGPPGWLGVTAYAFWKGTSTNWEKLVPAVVYMINVRAEKRLDSNRC